MKKCEERDSNLYKLAREGKIEKFTGISDPYEEQKSDITLNSDGSLSPEKLVDMLYNKISEIGYL